MPLVALLDTNVWVSGFLKPSGPPGQEAAIHGIAQYLVTRDDDLKRDLDLVKMTRLNRVRVVSVRRFLHRLSRRT